MFRLVRKVNRRLYLGGVGSFAGAGALVGGALVGALFFTRSKRPAHEWTLILRLSLGVTVAVQSLAWTFALPLSVALQALPLYALPVFITYALGCALLGTLLAHQDQRHENAARLRLEIENKEHIAASLQQSEGRFRALAERLHAIVEHSVDGLCVAKDGRIVLVNRAFLALLGNRSETSLLDQPMDDWVSGDAKTQLTSLLSKPDRKNGDATTIEVCLANDQEPKLLKVRVANYGNTQDFTLLVARDVTVQLRLEEQLRQSHKMEAIGQLAGGIAHDFNNLLAAIGGHAELIEMDTKDAQTQQSLREINKAVGRAKRLVAQILSFSRKRQPERDVLSLGLVVDEVLALLRPSIPSGIELVKVQDMDCSSVMADASQIHQVILNLATNAWHAVENLDRQARIEIRLTNVLAQDHNTRVQRLAAGAYTCLSVVDNGEGIRARDLPRVFEPFFTTKRMDRGTGLGLSVVHGIVAAHGGDVFVTSEVGHGTKVDVYLPAALATCATTATETTHVKDGQGKRILFVDDESSLVLLAQKFLIRLGYHVEAFTRPGDAIAAFAARPDASDLVVTDMNMPEFSGLDVAKAVLSHRPKMSVIITSGYITDDLRSKAEQLGVHELFSKPGTIEEFSSAIHKLAGA